MQNIVNHSPFAAGKHLTKDGKTGEKIFIVAVKATFDIQDNGDLIIADEQKEVLDSPVYYGEESASSVQYPPDLYFQKPLVDLIVNGSAYAPPEEEVTEIQVSISVGDDWTKELRVIGDRYWKSEFGILKKTSPEFFSSIPVIYENAFGGVDQSEEEIPPEEQKNHPYNPVGTGFAIKKRYLEGLKLPNVEYVGSKTGKNSKKNDTAGFGCVDSFWSPRSIHAGTHDNDWEESCFPYYPEDFNPLFYQWAPEDQQFESLPSGKTIACYHLSPKEEIYISIPEVSLEFKTRINQDSIKQFPKLQTVLIEPDLKKVYLTWTAELGNFEADDDIVTVIEHMA